jgi:hypothetical protein
MIEPGDGDRLYRMFLTRLRTLFEAGNKSALPGALAFCLRVGRKPPKWVCAAWVKAYEDATVKSWDEVLGSPPGKGTHRENRKLHKALTGRIVRRVLENGKVVPEVFEQIAKEIKADGIKISASTVKSIYYRPQGRMLRIVIEWCERHGLNSDFLA